MKTKHIFYGLLALLLVACNDDDYLTEVSIPDGEGQEIQSNPLKMTILIIGGPIIFPVMYPIL